MFSTLDVKTHLLKIHFLGKRLESESMIVSIYIDAVVNVGVANRDVNLTLEHLRTCAGARWRYLWQPVLFSQAHPESRSLCFLVQEICISLHPETDENVSAAPSQPYTHAQCSRASATGG